MHTIRVILPAPLQVLAKVPREVQVSLSGIVTARTILDALEAAYPALCGCIRHQESKQRRSLVRFFACEEDISHDSPDTPLPQQIVQGQAAFYIIGAIAGG